MLSEVKFIRAADDTARKVDAPGKQPVSDAIGDKSGQPFAAAPAVNPTLLRGLRPGFAARAAVVSHV